MGQIWGPGIFSASPCLFISPTVSPSLCLSDHLCVCLPLCRFCPSTVSLSLCLSPISLSQCLPLSPTVCLSHRKIGVPVWSPPALCTYPQASSPSGMSHVEPPGNG